MRLAELLSTRRFDWHTGRGGTPFIVSDEMERLHSEYVWQLCDVNTHMEVDLASHSCW